MFHRPIVGGFAAQYKGWRWTQWCILFLGTFSLIVSVGMKETYKKAILQNRAKRLGIAPPKATGPSGLAKAKFILMVTLFRPLHMLICESIVGLFSLYSAYTFGIVFAFFAAFPYTFTKVYHFDTSQNGLVFVAVGVGILLGWITIMLVDGWLYQKEVQRAVAQGKPHVAPEHRLYAAMVGSIGITVGIFWFAWTAREGVHWISPILATVPLAWGIMSVFVSRLVTRFGTLLNANNRCSFLPPSTSLMFTGHSTARVPWLQMVSHGTLLVRCSHSSLYKVSSRHFQVYNRLC